MCARACLSAALVVLTCLPVSCQDMQTALSEDFSGPLPRWGLDPQGGALRVESGLTLVPVFGLTDATIEYRVKVEGEGLVELLLRYDIDTDDYYIFRVDTRIEGGDPPGFLKRAHGDSPWPIAGERSGQTPPADTWLDVKVELEGDQLRGYVDGEPVATLRDADYKVGGLGFRAQLSGGLVDDLTVSVPVGASYTLLEPYQPPPEARPAPFTEGTWTASWIWSPGEPEQLSRVFRKRFDVPAQPVEATCVVTCDNQYALYLNGEFIGRDTDWYSVETYDLLDKLRVGDNVLAVACENDEPGAAGLLLEFGATCEDGRFVHVASDESWRAAVAAPEGWAAVDYDDGAWGAASVVGKYPCPPWSGQASFPLPYLGPKQPLELVGAEVPERIEIGRPLAVTATWKPTQPLRESYPIVLTVKQGGGPALDVAVFQPNRKTWDWRPGVEHTETFTAQILPDTGYLLEPGRVEIGLEVRGTFYTDRSGYTVGEASFRPPAVAGAGRLPAPPGPEEASEGSFTDPTGVQHEWKLDGEGRIVVDGVPYVPLDAEGVYWCVADEGTKSLADINWRDTVQRICKQGGPSGADFVRVRLVDHIDATKTDHEFSEDGGLGGKSRVLSIGGRSYRVTSARDRLSYFAYTATCEHPRNPHLMMYQSVNDRERYTTIRIQPPWDNVGGGAYTGREYPCDGRPYEQMFVFYPRQEAIRFTVSRRSCEEPIEPESGAAVAHVWLLELLDPPGARPVVLSSSPEPDDNPRRLGMYLTHPVYMYSLYGYEGRSETERKASLRSFIDYLKFCGINMLQFNAVDGGDTTGMAFYESDLWPRSAGDLLRELLPLCEANDIQLVPIVTSISVPEGKHGFTTDSFQMDRFGELTTFFSSRPPLPDPLRPEVQELLFANLREILDICAQSPAVGGVGFRVNGKIGLCYGGEALGKTDRYTGYSPWDIQQFREDTGIAVPEMEPTPYEWIHDNCWERWLDWRCERTRDLWLDCRDLVREYRDDLLLYISCDMPSETPAWNIYWPEGETPLDCMRYHGVDPRLFSQEPGIILQRGMMVAADRYFTRTGQYGRNVQALKDFHYAEGVAEMYRGAEGDACELYHNYWEEFGVFKIGQFRTEFWGAATMFAHGRNYFEPFAFSLEKTNCHTLNVFSWERGSFGHEHDLRAFARAFRALPRGEGEDAAEFVAGQADGLWVRRFGDRLAVLNTTGEARTVRLRYPSVLPARKDLMDFGRYRVVVAGGDWERLGVDVALELEAYELRTLGFEGE